MIMNDFSVIWSFIIVSVYKCNSSSFAFELGCKSFISLIICNCSMSVFIIKGLYPLDLRLVLCLTNQFVKVDSCELVLKYLNA